MKKLMIELDFLDMMKLEIAARRNHATKDSIAAKAIESFFSSVGFNNLSTAKTRKAV